jgi:hypothetical protein
MTASDKKKTAWLVLLLIGAGLSWLYVYRPTAVSVSNVTQKAAAKTKPAKVGQEAQIRVDMVENTSAISVGQTNLFQYRQKTVASKPPEPPRALATSPIVTPISASAQQQQPFVPPPQPWKAFRYEGFSVSKGGGKILGSITEGGNTYEVKEGDCMMGQFCVTRLTETLVEIEDLQLKRKQTFTRIQ